MPASNRRFAAARRIAPPSRAPRSRFKLTLTWLTVVTALSFFTFTVAATAAGSKPDYAAAAKGLPHDQPRIVIKSGKDEVCSVTAAQLALLAKQYDVGWMTVTMDGAPADLVTVSGADDHDMRKVLGEHVKCKLVKEKHVFYLPFDAQTS
jgi:hypothetical protein